MKPTPPMPLIHGSSAPIAMPVATAASIALPPLRRISAPTAAARLFWATTTPLPRTGCFVIFNCRVSDSLIHRVLRFRAHCSGASYSHKPCYTAVRTVMKDGTQGVMELSQIDLQSLAAGHKRTWDAFVVAASPLINAVVRRALSSYRLSDDDVM